MVSKGFLETFPQDAEKEEPGAYCSVSANNLKQAFCDPQASCLPCHLLTQGVVFCSEGALRTEAGAILKTAPGYLNPPCFQMELRGAPRNVLCCKGFLPSTELDFHVQSSEFGGNGIAVIGGPHGPP